MAIYVEESNATWITVIRPGLDVLDWPLFVIKSDSLGLVMTDFLILENGRRLLIRKDTSDGTNCCSMIFAPRFEFNGLQSDIFIFETQIILFRPFEVDFFIRD